MVSGKLLSSKTPLCPQGLHHLHSQGKIHRDIKVGSALGMAQARRKLPGT